jgi:isocitrate dehydrogenase
MAGTRIVADDAGRLEVPDEPIVPVTPGEGPGPGLWKLVRPVLDAAIEKSYRGVRKVQWLESPAGEVARREYGTPLPDTTVNAFRLYRVGLRGPMLEVEPAIDAELTAILDLAVATTPVRRAAFDVLVVRDGREDAGGRVELAPGTGAARELLEFLGRHAPEKLERIRFGVPERADEFRERRGRMPIGSVETGFLLPGISRHGTARVVEAALALARTLGRRRLSLLHESEERPVSGAQWLEWARQARGEGVSPEWVELEASKAFEAAVSRPELLDVVVAPFAAAERLLDLLTARESGERAFATVRSNPDTGHHVVTIDPPAAVDDAAHANPLPLLEGGEWLLRTLGWHEAADRVRQATEGALASGLVTRALAATGRVSGREVPARELVAAVRDGARS